MITAKFAQQIAKDWLTSWNNHDLECVLSHYSDDFVMISSYIGLLGASSSGVLCGKSAIGQYWGNALLKYPELHFELHKVLIGVQSVAIYYQGLKGMAAETFVFDLEGKVVKSIAHYE